MALLTETDRKHGSKVVEMAKSKSCVYIISHREVAENVERKHSQFIFAIIKHFPPFITRFGSLHS